MRNVKFPEVKLSPQDSFEAAWTAWKNGESKTAFALFLSAAERGDGGAQLNVGHFFDSGEAVKKSKKSALYWYKRAWHTDKESGACSNIAQVYFETGNRARALFWWNRAVKLGDGDAALALARVLLDAAKVSSAQRVKNLLRMAHKSKRITEEGRDEASALLFSLR